MAEQTNNPAQVQNPDPQENLLQQTQQPESSPQSSKEPLQQPDIQQPTLQQPATQQPTSNTPDPQSQVTPKPEKKDLKWWMWAIIGVVILGLGAGAYFLFFR